MADAHPYHDYSIKLVKLRNWYCGLRFTIRIIHHKTQHVHKHGQSRLGRAEKSMSVFETEKEWALNIYFICASSPSKVRSRFKKAMLFSSDIKINSSSVRNL